MLEVLFGSIAGQIAPYPPKQFRYPQFRRFDSFRAVTALIVLLIAAACMSAYGSAPPLTPDFPITLMSDNSANRPPLLQSQEDALGARK